jgi:hypothetical protein
MVHWPKIFLATGGGEVGEKNFKAKSGRKWPPTQNMSKGPVFLRYATASGEMPGRRLGSVIIEQL